MPSMKPAGPGAKLFRPPFGAIRSSGLIEKIEASPMSRCFAKHNVGELGAALLATNEFGNPACSRRGVFGLNQNHGQHPLAMRRGSIRFVLFLFSFYRRRLEIIGSGIRRCPAHFFELEKVYDTFFIIFIAKIVALSG